MTDEQYVELRLLDPIIASLFLDYYCYYTYDYVGFISTWQLLMAASRLIRFFSRRQSKTSKFLSKEKSHQLIPIKNGLVCTIIFLDGEEINFEVDVS